MPRSIAGRLALMFALAVTAVSTIAGIALFTFQSQQIQHHKREELSARFQIVERMVKDSTYASKWKMISGKLRDFTPPDRSLYFIVESPDPRFAFHSGALAGAQWKGPREGFGKAIMPDRKYLTLARTIPAAGERPKVRLVIALGRKYVDETETGLAIGIAVMSLLAIVAVAALGWWIARRSLASVDRLSEHARLLSAENMAQRLPTETLPAELSGLVLSLNDALDRVADSYQRLSTFNADVAHELRTPLANMIGGTQVALSRDRPVRELEEVLQSNLEELDRMRRIVNDMLFLARADQGEVAANLTVCSLAEETRKSAEFMAPVMEEAGVTLQIDGDAEVPIERSLFGRAITNLLDNAVLHGETPGRVTVTIAYEGDAASIGVSNPGAAIDPAHLDRIFDRFYRIDPARFNGGESHGFGLALVKAVARMHGGSVFARNEPGRICIGFTVARSIASGGD
ncbi:heavy metal sensor histidine kinase [Sphingomonas sp. BT-65]|uniref:heavy metal sensor histidine kinase n=1 Tax=Sphingomonas sp. BT-65 TaxID=2989821 RepID=UPI0022359CDA|nr:heavy metal sensor histidine kinase [Sphingomonas sp. BT-65]MCW4461512.1 heavy metal sensor histidine kinase [Sphingomonas sp. BT-65]